MPNIKCVVVGDGYVGKTCLLISYTTRRPPGHYVPTVCDNYATSVTIGGQPYSLSLFDTAGQEEYDRLRPLGYRDTSVFLVCFSVVCPDSFEHASIKWVPEIRHHCPRTPILIVGTKVDLREDPEVLKRLAKQRQKPVSRCRADALARNVGAVKYIECSALTKTGVKDVFDEAILAAVEPREPITTPNRCHVV